MRFFCRLFLCVVILSGMIGTDIGGAQVSWGIGKPLDSGRIDEIVGIKGAAKDGEYKITIPQKDLVVTVDGFRITPPMGLTSWVDFAPMQEDAMVMGDIVLLENEIGPVEKAAIEGGLTVTGLHNHFVRDKEKVMFMHIHGMGSVDRIAKGVRAVLDKIKELRRAAPTDAQAPSVPNTIDTRKIESILGNKGESSGGVFKVTIGRPDVLLKDHGVEVTSFMGFNTWAAFQGSENNAAVAGDFTMLTEEVAPVIEALVKNGIEVVAVHNHMVTETPRIFFLHFWGEGPAGNLVRGLKAALDRTGKPQGL